MPVYAYNADNEPYLISWNGGALGLSQVNEYSYKENYYTTNIYSDYFKQFDSGHYFKVMAMVSTVSFIKPVMSRLKRAH